MWYDSAIDELKTKAVAIVDGLDTQQIAEVNSYFAECDVYADAHVPQTARNRNDVLMPRDQVQHSECICVHTDDSIQAPHVFELALRYTPLAEAYLGSKAVMYSTNTFWTRPGRAPLRDDIQSYHVDADDTKFLAMFVYLTDVVSPDDGPHDLYGPDGVVHSVYGKAGTVFLADTSHRHRGRKPRLRERGLMWYRWGVSDYPPAGVWDKIQPIPRAWMIGRYPSDPELQERIKLLVT